MCAVILNNLVAQALINAHENGVTFTGFTAEEVAQDLVQYEPDLESTPWESLVPYVNHWFKNAPVPYRLYES